MKLQSKHFNPAPWPWANVRGYMGHKIAGGAGGQGAVFACNPELEGAVVKLYNDPRPLEDLSRVQSLIRMCKGLPPSLPATREWYKRLNLPLRPVLSPDGEFGGVVLPPLPREVDAREYRYDQKSKRMVGLSTQVRFEAQFVHKPRSPVGEASAEWQWRLLASLAETVALMHSVNMVHGDLSYTNVLALQKSDTHLDDHVYLIDVDDAFLDDGCENRLTVVRKSRNTYDPYSVEARRVSKETDVFVVALWAVAFMQHKFEAPEKIAQGVPSEATSRLSEANPSLPSVVEAALGPIGSRPVIMDLYKGIRKGAKSIGAVR